MVIKSGRLYINIFIKATIIPFHFPNINGISKITGSFISGKFPAGGRIPAVHAASPKLSNRYESAIEAGLRYAEKARSIWTVWLSSEKRTANKSPSKRDLMVKNV